MNNIDNKNSDTSDSMPLALYDTYRRGIYEFIPLSIESVSLYACGPTVYGYAHIGNLRNYVFVDVLRRVLEINHYDVQHVMNITDVGHLTSDADSGEDKMEKGARQQGKSAWQIAQYFEKAFLHDLSLIAIKQPSLICRATDHIQEQIDYIRVLQEKGFTYLTVDGVYFDTQKLPHYGKLARLDVKGLQAGKRVNMAEKRNITDFALWKFSAIENPKIGALQTQYLKIGTPLIEETIQEPLPELSSKSSKRQMQWPSPWGVGFPGWHIECSAMSEKYLGKRFDIHVGGEDHIPVHHSNEIAQCEGRHGQQPASFWMHGHFLQLGEEKLSKSGTSMTLSHLIDQGYDPLAFRYLLLTSHYRSRLQFSFKALDSASIALNKLYKHLQAWPDDGVVNNEYQQQFMALINHDLKMPQAMALLWAVVKSALQEGDKKATLLYFDRVLGLSLAKKQNLTQKEFSVPEAVVELLKARQQARLEKQWQLSDQLRESILEQGFKVVDNAQGYTLHTVK